MFKYRNQFEDWEKTGQDLHIEEEQQYMEVEPFAVNETTGEIINKTNKKKIIPTEMKNIYEEIQSYVDEVDIYKIIERAQMSGDTSLLNQRQALFTDYVNLPDNIAELTDLIKALPKEQKDALLAGEDELQSLVEKEIMAMAIKHGLIKQEEPPKETKPNE